jgi:uncharacterized protein (TIRG00374 family)
MSKPLITIAVLNHNGLERLKKTAPSYLIQNYPNVEILYLDNGSTDGSTAFLRKLSSKIKIIENKENSAYGIAKNKLVKESQGEYVLLLDNDIELSSSMFLEKIFQVYISIENPAFLSPLVKDSNKEFLDSLGLFYNSVQKHIAVTDASKLGNFLIPAYMGNATFFLKEIFVELGGFDQIFPINIDDYDLSARAYLMGYKNYMTGNCLVVHHGIEVRKNLNALKWRYKYYFAGFSRMIWKNYTIQNIIFWWPISSAWIITKATINTVRFRNLGPLISTLYSIGIFFQTFYDTLKERAILQAKRKVKNDEFLSIKSPANHLYNFPKIGKLLRVVVSLTLILILLFNINWQLILLNIKNANILVLIISGSLFFTSVLFSILRWSRVLVFYNISIKKVELYKLYLLGSFFSNFLPTSIGGDVYKYLVLVKKHGAKKKELLSSMVVERGIGFLTLFLCNIGLIWRYKQIIITNSSLLIIEILITLVFIIMVLVIILRHSLVNLINKLNLKSKIYFKIKDFLLVLNSVNISKFIFFACIYSCLFLLNIGVSTWLLFHAFHINISFFYSLFLITIINIIGILPISLNSIGVTEGLMVFLLGLIGISPSVAVAASLLGRISLLLASSSGGIVYLFQNKKD